MRIDWGIIQNIKKFYTRKVNYENYISSLEVDQEIQRKEIRYLYDITDLEKNMNRVSKEVLWWVLETELTISYINMINDIVQRIDY